MATAIDNHGKGDKKCQVFLIGRKDMDTQATMAFQAYANNDLVDVDETENVTDLKNKQWVEVICHHNPNKEIPQNHTKSIEIPERLCYNHTHVITMEKLGG